MVDTFYRPLRLVHSTDANGADRTANPRVVRRAPIRSAEAFWLALIAALVAWMVSPSGKLSRDWTSSSSGCLFVGKGGVICNGSPTVARKMAAETADTCLSLGRGGRYCPPAK